MRGLRQASVAVMVGFAALTGVPAPAERRAPTTASVELSPLQVSRRLRLPEGVHDLAVADEGTVAAVGERGDLFVAEARRKPRVLARLKDATCVSISRDGRMVACGYSEHGGKLSIWKAPRWEQPLTISTGKIPPVLIEISRSAGIASAHTGFGVRSWDTTTGAPRGPSAGWSAVFAWSPNGDVLAAVDGDTEVDLYARQTGWQRQVVRPAFPEVARERLVRDGPLDFQQYQHRLAWSPDGRNLAVESGFTKSIRVYDAASGKVAYESPLVDTYRTQALAWSADGRSLLRVEKSAVTRYSLAGGTPRVKELPDPVRVSAVALAPGGRWIALGYADGTVSLGALLELRR